MPTRISIIGKKFGKLKVLQEAEPVRFPGGQVARVSLCRCDCGRLINMRNSAMVSGNTRSCGCLKKEADHNRFLIHGACCRVKTTDTYITWRNMLMRCSAKYRADFPRYGGRGITVCDRWKVFSNFLEDMGERPPGMSIDRIDNSGNYTPENCRWATRVQQSGNKRNNHFVTVRGIYGCISHLARRFGVPKGLVNYRINHGWPVEAAFFYPRNPGLKPKFMS